MSPVTTDTCILCPNGCELAIRWEDDGTGVRVTEVTGHRCPRGIEYGTEEVTAPKRTVTTTVRVVDGVRPLVSVRTATPIPKGKIVSCLAQLRRLAIRAPISMGQILVEDVAASGVAVVATREVRHRR